MKYLKKFELKENNRIYWSVSTDKYKLEKQLNKLNCSDNFITEAIEEIGYYQDINDIFVGKYKNKNKYNWIMNDSGSYFRLQSFKFMGGVGLTQEELDEIELDKNTQKYNL